MRTDYYKLREEADKARQARVEANGWDLPEPEPVSQTTQDIMDECWPTPDEPEPYWKSWPGSAPQQTIVSKSMFEELLDKEMQAIQADLQRTILYGRQLKDSPIGKFYDLDPMSEVKEMMRQHGIKPGKILGQPDA